MENIEIVNNNVVISQEISKTEYVKKLEDQLAFLDNQINFYQLRKDEVTAKLMQLLE